MKKELPCLKCGTTTDNTLVADKGGAAWECNSCKNKIFAYTFDDMVTVVATKCFNLPEQSKAVEIPPDFRAYLEHHGGSAKEMEVSDKSLREHAEVTGKLPEVGKPMFARPNGASHPMMALPYGKVIRIES